MDYAKESHSGRIVAASGASSWRSYVCPRPECGGRVFLRDGGNRRAHFAHYAGQGTPSCDDYHPGLGSGSEGAAPAVVAVEEEPGALGLLIGELDGVWALNLRLPEIPGGELGGAGLTTLRTALIDVFAGPHRHVQISALELRPGVETTRVAVPPSLQEYRTQPSGTWPGAIDRRRWLLQARGLEAPGTMFRLRHGEWTRLLTGSAVQQGETLMLLADTRCPPPACVPHTPHFEMSSGGMRWTCWEVAVPDDLDSAGRWLQALGHSLLPKPWQLTIVTPARGFTEDGVPVFWLGDVATLRVDAPLRSSSTTTLDRVFESNTVRATVATTDDGTSYVTVDAPRPGRMRVNFGGGARSRVDLHFVVRTTRTLLEVLGDIPRLRIWVDETCLTAWGDLQYTIPVRRTTPHVVRVDLGHEATRARVTVWQRRSRRTHGGLPARDVASLLEAAISEHGVSLIEVDAEGLGIVRITPCAAPSPVGDTDSPTDRLAWRDHLLAQLALPTDVNAFAVTEHPRHPWRRVVRPVTTAALVRSRVALRGRNRQGDAGR